MSLQIRFVPFNPPQNPTKTNISQGTYTENPPWHQVQRRLQGRSSYPPSFSGNLTADSILAAARSVSSQSYPSGSLTTAGTVTINGNTMGSFDYIVVGTTTVSSFNSANWFTNTEDTRSAWVIVKGNLTINSGQTFIPPVRKLFTVIYVTGSLIVNGTISMSARGANHSGTGNSGGYTAPVDIRIGTGSFGAVTNPQIPATGGAGALAKSGSGFNNGTAGTDGGTGGGGTGEAYLGGIAAAGSAGTCFTGGTGSGGAFGVDSFPGVANGGAGGNGAGTSSTGGGTGNPGGSGTGTGGVSGLNGTGGTIIVICEGSLTGSGSIIANGVNGARPPGSTGGGASGGGSVNVLFGSNPSGVTVTANGGAGQASGNGGNGTARKLAIGSN